MGQGQEGCVGSPSPSPWGRIQPLPATTFRHCAPSREEQKIFESCKKWLSRNPQPWVVGGIGGMGAAED